MADRSARILLVDDEQSIQTLLSYPLRRDGYEVVQATDGRQALDRFEEQSFDLVVLDLMLPKIDGLEVCRRLRTLSSVPIIMLTAKTEEIDKVVGLELGADDYITKPFSLREFSSRIKAALRRAEMSRPVETAPDEVPLVVGKLRIDFPKRSGPRARERRRAHVRGVRDPVGPGARARAGVHAGHAPGAGSGATRPTATRARSTSTSATSARRSNATPRTRSTCSRCGESATASATPRDSARVPAIRISLRNKLALVFAAITFVAIGGLYLYVAPGLQDRLMHEKLTELAAAARKDSGPVRAHRRGLADERRGPRPRRRSQAPGRATG